MRLARLVRRSQQGDRAAFRALYRALYEPVSGFVQRRVQSQSEAEDLVAQVFLQLISALPRIDPRRGTVFAYVLGMARNLLVDRARSARSLVVSDALAPELPADQDLHQDLEAEQERAALRERVAALPPETQELLRLRFEEGMRYAEIAQIVGRGEAAVRQRISRAVRELRDAWGPAAAKGATS
jgi:RNA polymerase sigma-70 factor, ECF subfamily